MFYPLPWITRPTTVVKTCSSIVKVGSLSSVAVLHPFEWLNVLSFQFPEVSDDEYVLLVLSGFNIFVGQTGAKIIKLIGTETMCSIKPFHLLNNEMIGNPFIFWIMKWFEIFT